MDTRTSLDDLGWLDQYGPAPIYEAFMRSSPSTVINHTTPRYAPLLWAIGAAIGVHKCVEVGVAQGWSSGGLAWAVRESNQRYGMNGRYWGIDIADKSELQKTCDKMGLPATFIQHEKGSVDFMQSQTLWQPEELDLVYIDGWHSIPYVKQEIALFEPLIKGNGNGYLILHDIYAFVAPLHDWLMKESGYSFTEGLRFLPNYGIGIYRNMRGYDYQKDFWPDGDQSHLGFMT